MLRPITRRWGICFRSTQRYTVCGLTPRNCRFANCQRDFVGNGKGIFATPRGIQGEALDIHVRLYELLRDHATACKSIAIQECIESTASVILSSSDIFQSAAYGPAAATANGAERKRAVSCGVSERNGRCAEATVGGSTEAKKR